MNAGYIISNPHLPLHRECQSVSRSSFTSSHRFVTLLHLFNLMSCLDDGFEDPRKWPIGFEITLSKCLATRSAVVAFVMPDLLWLMYFLVDNW